MRHAWLGRGLAIVLLAGGAGPASLLWWQRAFPTAPVDLHALPGPTAEPAATPALPRHVRPTPDGAMVPAPQAAAPPAKAEGRGRPDAAPPVAAAAPPASGTVLAALSPSAGDATLPALGAAKGAPPAVVEPAAETVTATADEANRIAVEVRRGDTLLAILGRLGIGQAEAHAVASSLGEVYDPRRLRVGQALQIETAAAGAQLASLRLSVDPEREVHLIRDGDGFRAASLVRALERDRRLGRGTIEDSLFASGEAAGIPAETLLAFIRLFSWDVDFQRDIQPGAGFEVVYEGLRTPDGAAAGTGDVLYARLDLGGRAIEAFRFELGDGRVEYFDRNGKSARKFLMRTPVDGARLSSRFGMRRHPILGYSRMHKGVDFAAPTGTPVYAAGEGQVVQAGRNGGYGNYVRIRHNGEYATAYAHLSRFAKGLRRGARVRQGQVIGYVGSTGRSTGPHLHYEVLRSGQAIDPMKIAPVVVTGLGGSDLDRFRREIETVDRLRRELATPGALVADAAGVDALRPGAGGD